MRIIQTSRVDAIALCVVDVPLIVGCSIAGILKGAFTKKREEALDKKKALGMVTEEAMARQRIYMGAFRIAVLAECSANFHLGNNFHQAIQARHGSAPRSTGTAFPS